jgi:hypothetical protein
MFRSFKDDQLSHAVQTDCGCRRYLSEGSDVAVLVRSGDER